MYAHRLVLLIGLLVAGSDDAKKTIEKDMAAMQGDWLLIAVQSDGRTVDVPPGDPFMIRGDKCYTEGEPNVSLKIDPACSPKLLDLTTLAGRDETLEGIYRIEGDTLVWCWSRNTTPRERPQAFEAAKGSPFTVFHFTRVKH